MKASRHTRVLSAVLALSGLVGSSALAQEATPPAPTEPPTQEATQQEPAQPPAANAPGATQPEAPAEPAAQPRRSKRAQQRQDTVPEGTEFVEEMNITGTRIPRKELTTAAPVTVLTREVIEQTGRATVGEILQSLPEQSNAINTQFNNGGDGSTRVNLRGLGAGRTLVLLNGRRHVAGGTGADATVDLSTIPVSAIQRIEVLKDGGSAVYGSDAISGVVNIITRKDYVGTEATAFTGLSSRGDGLLYDLGLTTGVASERGNILISGGYYTQRPAMAGDRPFSKYDKYYDWNSRAVYTLGSSSIPNGVIRKGGAPAGSGNDRWNSLPAGSAYTYDPATGNFRVYNGTGVTDAGGDQYNYQPENYLVTPQERAHLYLTGNINLGAHVDAFIEGSLTNRQSSQMLAPEPLFTISEGVTVTADNVYNPFGRPFTDIRRRLVEFGNRRTSQDLTTYRIVTGLTGYVPESASFLKGWQWETSFNFGRTQGVDVKQGNLQRSRLAAAVGPSFYDEQGVARCGVPGAPIEGCVPLNLFGGAGTISKDMVDYLTYVGTARGFNQQASLLATAGGSLFSLSPSTRPVGLALGYEYRRELGANLPDPLTAKGDTTGNKGEPTAGGFYVNELFGELSVPVLARSVLGATGDEAGEDLLELTAAARAFRYSTFGNGATYKVGARVSPYRDVTLRGTWSTAFRAPTIGNLYSGAADSFEDVVDPCVANPSLPNCPGPVDDDRSQLLARLGGNPDLQPETAKIFTVGLVLTPRWVEDLSFTVDYYNIDIRNSITNVTADVILSSCHTSDPSRTPQYCERITRAEDGTILSIADPLSNVGGDRTSGVDFAVRYSPETPYGRIGLSADLTYLGFFDRELPSGDVIHGRNNYDLGGVYADWKGIAGVSWALDPFNAGVTVRYINGYQECANNTCNVAAGSDIKPISRDVEAYATVDLTLGYKLNTGAGTTTLSGGVNNVLDRAPARLYNGFLAGSDAATYDYMGRYFYVRLAHNF